MMKIRIIYILIITVFFIFTFLILSLLYFFKNVGEKGMIKNAIENTEFINIDRDLFFFESSSLYKMNLIEKEKIHIFDNVDIVQFSPDGTHLLFSALLTENDDTKRDALVLYDLELQSIQIIIKKSNISCFEWSPNSNAIAFTNEIKTETDRTFSELFIYELSTKSIDLIYDDYDIISEIKWKEYNSHLLISTLFDKKIRQINNTYTEIVEIETLRKFFLQGNSDLHYNQTIHSNVYYLDYVSNNLSQALKNENGSLMLETNSYKRELAFFDGPFNTDFQPGIINPSFIDNESYVFQMNNKIFVGILNEETVGFLTVGRSPFVFESNFIPRWKKLL